MNMPRQVQQPRARKLRPGSGHVHPTLQPIVSAIASGSHSQGLSGNAENSAGKRSGKVDPYAGYDWHGEYLILKERYPDKRVAAYIAWAAAPVVKRQPGKLIDLARLLGLKTDRTIRQWREKDETIDQTVKELQTAPLAHYRRDIYQALIASALLEGSGGHADRRLALEMLGDYSPKSRHEITEPVQPFTSDELAQATKELQQWQAKGSNQETVISEVVNSEQR